MAGTEKLTWELFLQGRVQGVGFRPTVLRLAQKLQLTGWVANTSGAATIVLTATPAEKDCFLQELRALPEPILISSIDARASAPRRFSAFTIRESGGCLPKPVVPADLGLCDACRDEMVMQGNRRYRYPYISCAQCGPRYTIMEALPYDRERTTMAAFTMCSACAGEYAAVQDRRCYGQTLSCYDCGPQLQGWVRQENLLQELQDVEALNVGIKLLAAGKIIAVKSVGGFNLVCRADEEAAVQNLRRLKHRPTKPLAVLATDIAAASKLCQVSSTEAQLLQSLSRPIVLLKRSPGQVIPLAKALAHPLGRVGIFLPPQGLYVLLAKHFPLVVTSCNQSGAPIIFKDEDMIEYFDKELQVSGLFTYERAILRPADDSVVQVVNDRLQMLRRTRGYMPEPIRVFDTAGSGKAVLAVGAQMEPALALALGHLVYPVQVPGHLEEIATQKHFAALVRDTEKLLDFTPQLVVHDLHPGYFTTSWAQTLGLKTLAVQHHHAHALSVIAEQHLEGTSLAVCFDGTGWGTDGTIWGGEFLLCQGIEFSRALHVAALPMIGGDISMKQGWKSALCQLVYAGIAPENLPLAVPEITLENWQAVQKILGQKMQVFANSSLGRLFDGVSALLGICSENTHQGRGAMELEAWAQLAMDYALEPVPLTISRQKDIFDPAPLFRELVRGQRENFTSGSSSESIISGGKDVCWRPAAVSGTGPDFRAENFMKDKRMLWRARAALGFHEAVIAMVVQAAQQVKCPQVLLTGGCFANRILLAGCRCALTQAGFKVYVNEQVSPGDGGIVLGQAYYGLQKQR